MTGMSRPDSFPEALRARYDEWMISSIWTSLIWLVLFSAVLPHSGEDSLVRFQYPSVQTAGIMCGLIWLWFLFEFIWLVRASRGVPDRKRRIRRGVAVLLFPAFRLGLRSFSRPMDIWLPFIGWKFKDKKLIRELAQAFSIPMICVVLLVLPIMAVEIFREEWITNLPWVRNLLGVGQQFIWLAFTYEFIVMISVSFKRLAYCTKHWIDLLIILLPIILFLLPFLSFLPIVRLARLGRLANLTRMMRMKRIGIKAFQLLALFAGAKQIGKNYHARRIDKLLEMIEEKEEELEELRGELSDLQEEQAQQQQGERLPG